MFRSEIVEDKIEFPCQYITQYLLGEIEFDVACDNTIEECNRLIEEYIKKHQDEIFH